MRSKKCDPTLLIQQGGLTAGMSGQVEHRAKKGDKERSFADKRIGHAALAQRSWIVSQGIR